MGKSDKKRAQMTYAIVRLNESMVVPLFSRIIDGDILKVGHDLDELTDDAFTLFKQEYAEIDSYEKWMSLVFDSVHDIVITEEHVGEVFRASVLIEKETQAAFALARKYHMDQERKGDGQQYIIHIMMISRILWALYQRGEVDRATLLAGICHDLLEDTTCTEKEIGEVCGAEVLKIVKAVSNDPDLEDQVHWEEKKEDYISSVEAGGKKAMTVALCDKIVNMQSLFAQYDVEGPSVWRHFNRGMEKKLWFESAMCQMLEKHLTGPAIGEYRKMVNKFSQLESD